MKKRFDRGYKILNSLLLIIVSGGFGIWLISTEGSVLLPNISMFHQGLMSGGLLICFMAIMAEHTRDIIKSHKAGRTFRLGILDTLIRD